jgi:hypothetical protein
VKKVRAKVYSWFKKCSVLRIRIRDPVYFGPLDPGSGMGKNQDPDPGPGMNIPNHFSESLETIFWVKILKFSDADPGSGIFLTLDPGKFGSGINIPVRNTA